MLRLNEFAPRHVLVRPPCATSALPRARPWQHPRPKRMPHPNLLVPLPILLGRFAPPAHCLAHVLGNTLANIVSKSHQVLCRGIPLLGSFSPPAHCLSLVLDNALANIVCRAQSPLRRCKTLLSRFTVPSAPPLACPRRHHCHESRRHPNYIAPMPLPFRQPLSIFRFPRW